MNSPDRKELTDAFDEILRDFTWSVPGSVDEADEERALGKTVSGLVDVIISFYDILQVFLGHEPGSPDEADEKEEFENTVVRLLQVAVAIGQGGKDA